MIFKTYSQKEIKKANNIVKVINGFEKNIKKLSNEELKNKTNYFKEKLNSGCTLDDILPEAFAVVKEVSSRVLNMTHYDVQLIGGIILHKGGIAEMKTGEGKTLVSTLPVYLNALEGKGVHVVTVNDYLAKRDAEWMGKIYKFLGLSVGVITHELNTEQRKIEYAKDIVYVTNNELGFDYLKDNMAVYKENQVLRGLNYAVIDEADSVLIDEARTPLIISGKNIGISPLYRQCNQFVKNLIRGEYKELNKMETMVTKEIDEDGDFIVNEKDKQINLTESGLSKAEKYFNVEDISDAKNIELMHCILGALRANYLMFKDKDYIVKDGQIMIVDEFTGRIMPGRRYSDGLHQAIEAKENVKINQENKTCATITFQNFFNKFNKKAGMTGTAMTEADEFNEIYNMDVVEIPTNKPVIRKDLNDVIYKTEKAKFNAIVDEVYEVHKTGQPILIGTITVENSEKLSKMLKKKDIPHNVLNAKFHEKEAEIIAEAGRYGMVTIATNMAGRGTDIILGGNPEFEAKKEMKANGYTSEQIEMATDIFNNNEDSQEFKDIYNKYLNDFSEKRHTEQEKVKRLGGLYIIGTERHESRRIDNQLRGRAGRQGDPGKSKFYISLEDDFMRLFSNQKAMGLFNAINIPEDTPLEHKMLSSTVERAQKHIEGNNYAIRKQLCQYDYVMNVQRDIIYKERQSVLNGENIRENILGMMDSFIESVIDITIDDSQYFEEWNLAKIQSFINEVIPVDIISALEKDNKDFGKDKELFADYVKTLCHERYAEKEKEVDDESVMRELERIILLNVVDNKWMQHIDDMEIFKQGIGLMAYGQKDPLIEYRMGAYDMFEKMTKSIQEETIKTLFTIKKEDEDMERHNVPEAKNLQYGNPQSNKPYVREHKKIGRNDPCPCGSGKKYKNCCGKNA